MLILQSNIINIHVKVMHTDSKQTTGGVEFDIPSDPVPIRARGQRGPVGVLESTHPFTTVAKQIGYLPISKKSGVCYPTVYALAKYPRAGRKPTERKKAVETTIAMAEAILDEKRAELSSLEENIVNLKAWMEQEFGDGSDSK